MSFLVSMTFNVEGDISLPEADEAINSALMDLSFNSKPKVDVRVYRPEREGGEVFAEVTLVRRETSAFGKDDAF